MVNLNNLNLTKTFVALFALSFVTITSQEHSSEPDCKYGTELDRTNGRCSDPECPASDSIGIFPDCKCTATNFDYSVSLNKCFRVCPDNSTGYWPNCKCTGDAGFDKENFQCVTCPSNAVSGIFPNCVCEDDNAEFNARKNACEYCPFDSSGKIPNCICDDGVGKIIRASTQFHAKCLQTHIRLLR